MTDETYTTIEPNLHGEGVAVYTHGVYPDWSVLAGQDRRAFLARFDTVEEARAAYPDADVLGHSTKAARYVLDGSLGDLSGLPREAPAWFDPMAAGESWGSDW